jgi:SHS2 domain-containing protein
MPYEYLDDIATADVAFRAWAATLESMIAAAGDATVAVMIGEPGAIHPKESREISVASSEIDMLLYDVLHELLFYKDSQSLLLRIEEPRVTRVDGVYHFTGVGKGEKIDRTRHKVSVDVKAVTLHRFAVRQAARGWEATVVLDI